MRTIKIADLFCGAGGASTGLVQACTELGYRTELTAINHWDRAIETHSRNHPSARHLCASLDAVNPRTLYRSGELDVLWASPECTHHSRARGGKPINDQSRATAFCVTRCADAWLPKRIWVENVPEFVEWGPVDEDGKPIKARKGETFRAWLALLASFGYRIEYRVLVAADFGDATTRRRLVVQAVLGNRPIIWPVQSHADPDLLAGLLSNNPRLKPWLSAAEAVIDWTIPSVPIDERKRPLVPNTLRKIHQGLERYYGQPMIIAMEHGGRVLPASAPLPTITTAKRGAFGVAFIVEYYGNSDTQPVTRPLPTVTTRDRFGLVTAVAPGHKLHFRMLRMRELAAAQSFPKDYYFSGTNEDAVAQIGNSVPINLARALAKPALQYDLAA